MNFYKHHIGDYDADTAHLTWLEDMAYTRLMRLYYRREAPIPADIGQACRLVRATGKQEREAVEAILNEFFFLQPDGWHNKRCDEEIDAAQTKADKNREVGKLGGRPRKKETITVSEKNHDGFKDEPTYNPSQTPDTRHQTPEELPVVGNQPSGGDAPAGNATRVGALCKHLRSIGIDAAPHLPVWPELIGRFTDDEIIAVAEIARARKPDERIHLHYLVRILNEPAKAPAVGGKRKPAPDNFDNRDYGQGGRL